MIIVAGPGNDGGGGDVTHDPMIPTVVSLVGSDGTVWDLSAGQPVSLMTGTRFGIPDPEVWFKESPNLDGSEFQGYRVPDGDPFLPVLIKSRSSIGWRDLKRQFRRSVGLNDQGGTCTLVVSCPDGVERRRLMRCVSGWDAQYDVADPVMVQWGTYGLGFRANPYFYADDVVASFSQPGLIPWLPAFPMHFAASQTFESATVTNPGDVKSPPRYVITGPYSTATVGLGGSFVELTTPIGPSEQRVVDMRQEFQTITDAAGNDKSIEAVDAAFESIPFGTDVELTISLTGYTSATKVDVSFTPLYAEPY